MYQALYRKYRPRTFDDVVGQEHITETLKSQVASSRLSHAYLFIGTPGTGKTTCAKILAKAVNCESPVRGNPCCRCRSCLGIEDGSVMDVVEMDAASNNGVDNVRQLRDEAVFSPASVNKRVYIIDEVHMLSTSAFNALLKILEEPPAHLMFILATTELHKVPATILARCQRHSFKRLDLASIEKRLGYVAAEEGLSLTADAASLIARLSEGGMRDALSLLDQCSGRERIDSDAVYSAIGLAGRRSTARLLSLIASHGTAQALLHFEKLWMDGKDPASLLGEVSGLMRDILMKKVSPQGSGELLSGGYDDETLNGFVEAFTPGELINSIEIIQSALSGLRTGQARTVCELCIIRLCEPELGDDLPHLRERVAKLERALAAGVPAAPPAPASTDEERPPPEDSPPFDPEPQRDSRSPFDQAPPPDDSPPFDLDPAPFDVPDRPVHPAPPVREGAQPPDTAASGDWERVKLVLNGKMPIGLYSILTDSAQLSAGFSDGTLTLAAASAFALNMLNRPDIVSAVAQAAEEVTGKKHSVRIVERGAAQSSPAPSGEDELSKLSRFDIVKFK